MNSLWNNKELPQRWKKSIIISIFLHMMHGDIKHNSRLWLSGTWHRAVRQVHACRTTWFCIPGAHNVGSSVHMRLEESVWKVYIFKVPFMMGLQIYTKATASCFTVLNTVSWTAASSLHLAICGIFRTAIPLCYRVIDGVKLYNTGHILLPVQSVPSLISHESYTVCVCVCVVGSQ
jgi:hypothetical protein